MSSITIIDQIIIAMIPYTARKLSQTSRQIPRSLPFASLPAPTDMPGCLSFIQKQANSINSLSQNNYLLLQKWLAENVLAAVKEISGQGKTKAGLYEVFKLCGQVKVYRSGVFGILEDNIGHIDKYTLMELTKIYEIAVYLKHPGHMDFLAKLRATILHKFKTRESVDKVTLPYFLSFLSSLALDPSLPNPQKSPLLTQLSPVLQNSMPLLSQYKKAKMNNYSSLFEQTKLYNIQVLPAFGQLLEEANRRIDSRQDREDKEDKQEQGEMGRDSFYFSTFQKIFMNALNSLGYSFNLNTLIKGNQYDIIITGKNKEKHCPLANTPLSANLQSHPSMPLQKVRQIAQSKNIEWHESHQPLQKVVLALNGPIHYIDSDVHGRNTITRKEEFQYEKLVLYGIHKYTLISYEDWWKISRHTRQMEQFIQEKIENPTRLPDRADRE